MSNTECKLQTIETEVQGVTCDSVQNLFLNDQIKLCYGSNLFAFY